MFILQYQYIAHHIPTNIRNWFYYSSCIASSVLCDFTDCVVNSLCFCLSINNICFINHLSHVHLCLFIFIFNSLLCERFIFVWRKAPIFPSHMLYLNCAVEIVLLKHISWQMKCNNTLLILSHFFSLKQFLLLDEKWLLIWW